VVLAGTFAGASAVFVLVGGSPPPPQEVVESAPAATVSAVSAASLVTSVTSVTSGPRPPVAAHASIRCAECHAFQHERWSGSIHARSDSSPLYVAMRAKAVASRAVGIGVADRASGAGVADRASGAGDRCDACHSPLKALLDPSEPAAREGVTCEVCHAVKSVREHDGRMEAELDLRDSRKYGPVCSGKEIYFHKTGCSPLHKEARFCAACHQASAGLAKAEGIPIYTDFDEWRGSSYATAGINCQDCHMPGVVEDVASGSQKKGRVGDHGFLGDDGELKRRAISMNLSVEDKRGKLFAKVTLKNEAGGHAVPTGMPGRQIALHVRVVDGAGAERSVGTRAYGRVLLDEGGAEVPFFEATREGPDTRLKVGETREEVFSFAAPARGEIAATLVWRSASPALSAAVGVEAEEVQIAEARIPLGMSRSGAGLGQAHGRAMRPPSAVKGGKP
jgi:hypothetical protein